MKLNLFTICILTTIYSFGQDTYLKEEKKGESYYVLKGDPNIKHGTYQYSNKRILLEKGQYDNGKKIGAWEFYDAAGNLEQKYDYSTNQLLFNREPKQFATYKVIVDGKPTDIVPDTLPIFIGGLSRYERFISNNLKYPGESKSKGIEGKQFVLITLSKQGDILNASIYRPISPDIDQEALRLIKELPKEWIPARHQNEIVEVVVGLPVLFSLK